MAENIDVQNNKEKSRYESTIEGHTAIASYSLDGNTITFTHTEVPDALAGRGIASKLVGAALEDCRGRGLRVVPQCSYVAGYIDKHPEYKDLVGAAD
jgi:predicted GNAT family acetyltransferase